jgi:hypothetical protein
MVIQGPQKGASANAEDLKFGFLALGLHGGPFSIPAHGHDIFTSLKCIECYILYIGPHCVPGAKVSKKNLVASSNL